MRNISFGIAPLLAVLVALTLSLTAGKVQAGASSSIPKGLDHIAGPNPNGMNKRTKAQGWITGCITDAVTDAPLARVQVEVYARIVDKLSDGTLAMRSMEETIPLGIVSYTNSKGKFKVKVPLNEDTNYFKVIVHTEGYQELQNMMVKVEPLKRSVVNFQLIKIEPTPQETEILDQKHELQKMNLLEKNPSFIQTIDTTKDAEIKKPIPNPMDIKGAFLYQQTYMVPDQVYVVNLSGYTGYIDLDDFISGVISAELGGTFPFETLKAQAVVSRSYALERYNRTGVANGGQAYTSTLSDTCRTATVNTSKIVVLYGGNVISAYFSARCNGDSTLNSEDGVWHKTGTCSVGGNYVAYARSKPCSGHVNCNVKTETPCCNVTTGGRNVYIYGHGVGMCQRGAEQFACRDGKNWHQILTGYYTDITIANMPALDVGNRIVTASNVNARLTPCSGDLIQVPAGTLGTLVTGPNISFCPGLGTCNGGSGTHWTWWQVDYDNGVTGRWSVENYLKKTHFEQTCTYIISPTGRSHGSGSETGSIEVTASWGSCSWTAVSNATWITVISGDSGMGNGTMDYSVSANTGATLRTGTITIAEQTFTITQDGTAGCKANSITVAPNRLTLRKNGNGNVTVTVKGADNCPVEGVTVIATISGNGNEILAVSPGSQETDANGQATFTINAKDKQGTAAIKFRASGLSKPTTLKVKVQKNYGM